jgi:hypothetical protein
MLKSIQSQGRMTAAIGSGQVLNTTLPATNACLTRRNHFAVSRISMQE